MSAPQRTGGGARARAGAARTVAFTVNGRAVEVDRHPMARLLDVLREDLGLTGTKEGCGEGECGACTVLLDGDPVCSCLVPLAHARGREVLTIEGLGGDHPLQRAFVAEGGAQCGACTPGMIMAALALPPRPTRERIRTGLAGNLCRCTGYEAIYRAVERATLEESGLRPRVHGESAAGTRPESAAARRPGGGSHVEDEGGPP